MPLAQPSRPPNRGGGRTSRLLRLQTKAAVSQPRASDRAGLPAGVGARGPRLARGGRCRGDGDPHLRRAFRSPPAFAMRVDHRDGCGWRFSASRVSICGRARSGAGLGQGTRPLSETDSGDRCRSAALPVTTANQGHEANPHQRQGAGGSGGRFGYGDRGAPAVYGDGRTRGLAAGHVHAKQVVVIGVIDRR